MNTVNEMSGIEFEKLCCRLMQEMSFTVETTKQSGDGGIDLVARNDQPMLKGIYIVQCKRYSGSVGEPIIRDLYGVVTSERANKGILITTGSFTLSAMRFAEGKNIELIDGEQLQTLLTERGLSSDSLAASSPTNFLDFPNFDKDKYLFYRNIANREACNEDVAKDFVFGFLFDYLENRSDRPVNLDLVHSEFADEYIQRFGWFSKKYFKRSKKGKEERYRNELLYRDIALLYNFDIFDYVSNRYKYLANESVDRFANVTYTASKYGYYSSEVRDGTRLVRVGYKGNDLKSLIEKTTSTNADTREKYWLDSWLWPEHKWGKEYRSVRHSEMNFLDEYCFMLNKYSLQDQSLANLLSLFCYFGIEDGLEKVYKRLFDTTDLPEGWVEKQPPYQYFGKRFRVFGGKSTTSTSDEWLTVVDMQPYYDKFAPLHQDKIDREIKMVNELLSTLP